MKVQNRKFFKCSNYRSEIFHEGPKPKILQITRIKFKKNILQVKKPKMTYITGGVKHYYPLRIQQ